MPAAIDKVISPALKSDLDGYNQNNSYGAEI
jgi:hypothetical protein